MRENVYSRRRGYALSVAISGLLLTPVSAFAGTYFIAANGSDSNNGTSKSSPWLMRRECQTVPPIARRIPPSQGIASFSAEEILGTSGIRERLPIPAVLGTGNGADRGLVEIST